MPDTSKKQTTVTINHATCWTLDQPGLCLENWLACLISKDNLRVKLLFETEILQYEGSITLALRYVLVNSRRCSLFRSSYYWMETPRKPTHVSTNHVREKLHIIFTDYLRLPNIRDVNLPSTSHNRVFDVIIILQNLSENCLRVLDMKTQ
jgi:hypothetical protein